jgi:hypothetical protein
MAPLSELAQQYLSPYPRERISNRRMMLIMVGCGSGLGLLGWAANPSGRC